MSVQDDVRDRGRETLRAAGENVTERAEQGKGELAERLHRVAGSVRRSAEGLRQEESWLADLVESGSNSLDEMARDLQGRDLGSIAGGVQGFARRNPAAFLGASVALGFVLGRVARTAAQRQGMIGAGSTGRASPSLPYQRPVPADQQPPQPHEQHHRSPAGEPSGSGIVRPQGPEAARSLRGQDSPATVGPAVATPHGGLAEPGNPASPSSLRVTP